MKIDRATARLIQDPQKRWAWIIYQLGLQGRSLAEVAAGGGVKRQTLYVVQRHPYPRMEKIIADALDMTPAQLFSERYDADGLPARKWGRPYKKISCHGSKDNTTRAARNTQLAQAA